jgi:hypothetical protein
MAVGDWVDGEGEREEMVEVEVGVMDVRAVVVREVVVEGATMVAVLAVGDGGVAVAGVMAEVEVEATVVGHLVGEVNSTAVPR